MSVTKLKPDKDSKRSYKAISLVIKDAKIPNKVLETGLVKSTSCSRKGPDLAANTHSGGSQSPPELQGDPMSLASVGAYTHIYPPTYTKFKVKL